MPANFTTKHLLLGMLFLVLTLSTVKVIYKTLGKNDRLEAAKDELYALQQAKSQLERDIEYKKTESFVEETARNELNMMREGEELFVIKGLDDATVLGDEDVRVEVVGDSGISLDDEDKGTYKENLYSWYRLVFD